ncbi:MAG: alpha/beta hydrolase [Caldilineaceae bacterium]
MQEQFVDIRPEEGGVRLHIRTWEGRDPAFLLVHGLSSNSRTWRQVADLLAAAGHRVVAVDQRGHGRSDKPAEGYDFATVTDDLLRLMQRLELDRPLVAGQSWGGNVVLELGARHPDSVRGLMLVDGGYIEMQLRPEATWEQISVQLRPPDLVGTPYAQMLERMKKLSSRMERGGFWIRWKTLSAWPTTRCVRGYCSRATCKFCGRCGSIVRRSSTRRSRMPVLICVAEDGRNPERMQMKRMQVAVIESALRHATVHWFPETDHDIHVHRPHALAQLMLTQFQDIGG